MAQKNGTILNFLTNVPCRAGAPLLPFFFPIAKKAGSRFQPSITAPKLKARFPFRRFRLSPFVLVPFGARYFTAKHKKGATQDKDIFLYDFRDPSCFFVLLVAKSALVTACA
jgi:hypothetical protein